jgi:hypothetical protein
VGETNGGRDARGATALVSVKSHLAWTVRLPLSLLVALPRRRVRAHAARARRRIACRRRRIVDQPRRPLPPRPPPQRRAGGAPHILSLSVLI